MSHTVIGVFDNQSEAQAAIAQLMSNGFTRELIDISSQQSASATSSYGGATADRSNDSVGEKVGNFFSSMFNDKDDASRYSQVAQRGTTVTVHARSSEEATRAADILDRSGAVDLDEKAGQYGYGANAARSTTDNATSGSLPVIEEELEVGKRVVETGGVRLRSRVIERPVEEHIRLREEHVHVERNPVNRDATAADFNNFKEGTIELTEHAEVPVVGKEARVVEEVRLETEVEERNEVVRDTVRSTEVDVENLGTGTANATGTTTGTSGLDASGAATTGLGAAGLAGAGMAGAGMTGAGMAGAGMTGMGSGSTSGGTLRRMSEIKNDYEVADDDEDVMDWDVVGRNGEKIGEVEDMIVDMQAMKVRYLEVELDGDLSGVDDDRRILIPVGLADLDHSGNNVVVSNFDSSMVSSYPAYRGEPITRDYEHSLMSAFSPGYQSGTGMDTSFYDHEHFRRRPSTRGGVL